MRRLLFLVSLLFAATAHAQPLPGTKIDVAKIAGTPASTLTSPTSSTTGQAFSVNGPMGAIWLTNSALENTSTASVLVLSGSPGATLYRGDIVTVAPISFAYSQLEVRGEVESVSGVNITLKNPLPLTPNDTYFAKFFRRADIPLSVNASASPYVITDALTYYASDGTDTFGEGLPFYHLPAGGWDQSNSKNRMFRIATSAPGASDYGLIVRGAGTFAATQSGSWTNACTQSGTWNINNVSGTVSLPTGASTAALQTTGNTSLSSIDGKLPALSSSRVPVEAVGNVAHGASDSGNPVKTGYKGRTANPTAVSDGQRVDALGDKLGRGIYGLGCLPENEFSGVSGSDITNTTSTSVVSAGGAGVKYAVYCITVSNMHSSSAARVDIQDSTTTKWSCPAAAGGGGCAVCSPVPFFTGTANTALQAQASASATIRVSLSGCKVP